MNLPSTLSSLPFRSWAALLAGGLVAVLPSSARAAEADGATELFAGDLSNAIQETPWKVEDGVLSATGHGTIWTRQSYGNFVLDLDFKVSKDANSGVFLHSFDLKNPVGCLEIQVHDSTDGTQFGMVGALYDAKAPSESAAKPVGEWNHYTITFKGSKLMVVLNAVKILDLDLNDWTTVHLNPDGTRNKFPRPLKAYAAPGPLGLQGLHGKAAAPVWYRNIRIRSLD